MKFTNKFNLPDVIVSACVNDPYSKQGADYSCTELLKPPLQIRLQRDYDQLREDDVSKRLPSILGSAVHTILQDAAKNDESIVTELRLFVDIYGKTISGALDYYNKNTHTLMDYKVVKAISTKYSHPDHIKQLNILRFICLENNIPVIKIMNCYILKDWDEKQSERDDNYPKCAFFVKEHKIWELRKTKDLIFDRVNALNNALSTEDLDTIEECDTWNGRRCEDWCDVRQFCTKAKKPFTRSTKKVIEQSAPHLTPTERRASVIAND